MISFVLFPQASQPSMNFKKIGIGLLRAVYANEKKCTQISTKFVTKEARIF